MPGWDSMFALSMPLAEIGLRGTIMFLAITGLMRMVGQRESGGLGITDVLLVVLIADAAGSGLRGDASSITEGLLLVGTILFWSISLDAIAYRSPRFAAMIKGKPKPLIKEGSTDRRVMRRELMTTQELLSQLRLHGLEDIAAVERAYLEPNGMISIVPKEHLGTTETPPSSLP